MASTMKRRRGGGDSTTSRCQRQSAVVSDGSYSNTRGRIEVRHHCGEEFDAGVWCSVEKREASGREMNSGELSGRGWTGCHWGVKETLDAFDLKGGGVEEELTARRWQSHFIVVEESDVCVCVGGGGLGGVHV
jgi:hypothetical protein